MTNLESAFSVPLEEHLLTQMIHGFRKAWIGLSKLETSVLAEELDQITIDRPVYVAGLARSGTTLILEILASHPEVATHKYRDFPAIFTPFWWNRLLDKIPRKCKQPEERAHLDGLYVTAESPEAMEESLWMAFFPQTHAAAVSSVLGASLRKKEFERFYQDHIRKILLIRSGSRYVAKGNYNISRLAYLQRIFADAKFVVPIRHPVDHVASLMKQHALFSRQASNNPRALAHLRSVGHFEFGPERRVINLENLQIAEQIEDLWKSGQDLQAWARYWAYLYGWVEELLKKNATLRAEALVVRYEDLCDQPEHELPRLLNHCQLDGAESIVDRFAIRIQAPTYYEPPFDNEQQQLILHETADVARRFGYEIP